MTIRDGSAERSHTLDFKEFEQVARQLQQAVGQITAAAAAADAAVSEILILHLFIERQLDEALARRLPRPQEIIRFGFGHKVALLKALHAHPRIDQAAATLLGLNEIRNAAAHNDTRALVAARKKLTTVISEALDEGQIVEPGERLETLVIITVALLHLALYDSESSSAPPPA